RASIDSRQHHSPSRNGRIPLSGLSRAGISMTPRSSAIPSASLSALRFARNSATRSLNKNSLTVFASEYFFLPGANESTYSRASLPGIANESYEDNRSRLTTFISQPVRVIDFKCDSDQKTIPA